MSVSLYTQSHHWYKRIRSKYDKTFSYNVPFFCPEGTAAEVRDFASQVHYENVIPRDPGLMVFSNSPSRVFCGALCSTYKTFCKTFLYDLVTKHCLLWDKTFEDSCATDIMPSTGIQAYGFNFIGKLIIAYNWKNIHW